MIKLKIYTYNMHLKYALMHLYTYALIHLYTYTLMLLYLLHCLYLLFF